MSPVGTERESRVQAAIADDLEVALPNRGRAYLRTLLKLLPGILFLCVWELGANVLFDARYVSQPTVIAHKLYTLTASGVLLKHFRVTFLEMVIGYSIGAVFGICVGSMFGRVRILREIFEPYIVLFNGIPKVALAPMFIVWFGIGIWSKVAIIASMVFFLVFANTLSGMNAVDEEHIGIVRLMGAGPWKVLREVVVPSAMPYMIAGLKTGVPYSVIGAMVGEFVAATAGVGYYISYAQGVFDTSGLFAGVASLLIVVIVLNQILDRVEKRVLSWKPALEENNRQML